MKQPDKISKIQSQKLIRYYFEIAEEDLKTVNALFEGKRYYACLFFLHLVIEKILKAIVVQKINIAPPLTHDLVLLSELANIDLSPKQIDLLRIINQFNIRTRYDDYKKSFYKLATYNYTLEYLNKGKKIILWLKQFMPSKK
ncbi:MAG: HEPN domain-containing protein [Candidatus Kuenenbacteria bacterium]